VIYYIRDGEGSLIGLKYNNEIYYYIKNMQEDIIGITDSNNNLLCSYEYDSWGYIISIKDNNGNIIRETSHIGIINPYRYRSYYYDNETKLYYLNSRYYNPEWGRFINIDEVSGEIGNVMSHNMYLYAANNPIKLEDNNGTWPKWLKTVAKVAVGVAVIAVSTAIVSVTAPAMVATFAVGAAKTALTVGAVSATYRATNSIAKSVSKKKDLKSTVRDAGKAAVEGFADGFVTGSILSSVGALSTVGANSNGLNIGHTEKPQYGRISIGYGSGTGEEGLNNGMTLINYSNKSGQSRFRLDADPKNMVHMHFGPTNRIRSIHRKTITEVIFGVITGG